MNLFITTVLFLYTLFNLLVWQLGYKDFRIATVEFACLTTLWCLYRVYSVNSTLRTYANDSNGLLMKVKRSELTKRVRAISLTASSYPDERLLTQVCRALTEVGGSIVVSTPDGKYMQTTTTQESPNLYDTSHE